MIPKPKEIGTIHFIGIGGIGMSGIAEVLHNLGYAVQGSDVRLSQRVEELRSIGVPVEIGHDSANLGAARAVVVSSAVPAGNVEVLAAREEGIPIVKRAEMLAELMRLKRQCRGGPAPTARRPPPLLRARFLTPRAFRPR